MTDTTSRDILADLVAFDTTSRHSNLPLIDYVRALLTSHGVASEVIPSPDGQKASLWATIGPAGDGGLILSGHTDCVPVEGQAWSTDPFALTERDGRLYGRGSADMKGFLACVLAAVPDLIAAKPQRPIHIAFSYDEEVGCTGVRGMIAAIAGRGLAPAACLVGEPTSMQAVVGHKGGQAYRCHVRGSEAHSSLAPQAVNAIDYAADLIVFLRGVASGFATGPHDADFDLPHSTLSTGLIEGGTAVNIVPKDCSFVFEYRNLIDLDPAKVFATIEQYARGTLEPAMKAIAPGAGISFEPLYEYPAHTIDAGDPLVTRLKSVLHSNAHSKVAFGTEAGLFQRDLGVKTVICGPGSINVAHKPDEYIDIAQIAACDGFLRRLAIVHSA